MFSTILANSKDEASLTSIVDVAVKTIASQSSNVDSRLFCYALVEKFPIISHSLSEKIILTLSILTGKENNVFVLQSCFNIMSKHMGSVDPSFASEFLNSFVLKGMSNSSKFSNMKGSYLLLWKGYSSKLALDNLGAENVDKIAKIASSGVGLIKSSISNLLDVKKESPAFAQLYYATHWLLKAAEWEVGAGNGNDIGIVFSYNQSV